MTQNLGLNLSQNKTSVPVKILFGATEDDVNHQELETVFKTKTIRHLILDNNTCEMGNN